MKYERAKAEIISFDGNRFMTYSGEMVVGPIPDGPYGSLKMCQSVKIASIVDGVARLSCKHVQFGNGTWKDNVVGIVCNNF